MKTVNQNEITEMNELMSELSSPINLLLYVYKLHKLLT